VESELAELNHEITGRVLIVDDDLDIRMLHRAWFSKKFETVLASSGEQALQICKEQLPDLILLDVMMPDMDGFDTCRELREFTDIPIIFATANELPEEHLKAFDAGGDDIIVKPAVKEILLRKVSLAIQRRNHQLQLLSEKDSMQSMAMSFLSAIGENGVLQKFMKASLTSTTPKELGEHLVEAIKDFGLECCVLIRDHNANTMLTSKGHPSAIEISILEQSVTMGRFFQFKNRMAVNYDRVSVIVTNMPMQESDTSGRMRDNITMLTEMTNSMCENVDMRQASLLRAEKLNTALATAMTAIESLDNIRQNAQVDLRLVLQELVDNIEKAYSWLATTRGQEKYINDTMHYSVDKALQLLESTGNQYDAGFSTILSALHGSDIKD
jgi:CheY-like chemotaxis protein